ncbi:MAG: flagellar basal body rod protein FlgB [Treponema sp.]|jgi:flagellar basal-body rod protein FlgB|nr:flagellar basal body rod protein FlgB [Treponema sp.]
MSNFSRTLDLLNRAMDTGILRDAVYADNLANKDVPNWKRTEVNFESELKKAVLSENYKPSFEMARSDPRHISNWTQLDYRDARPRRVLDYLSSYNNNGNNVDPEEEFNKILKNQLQYTLYAHAAAFEYGQVSLVLRA